MPTIRLQEGDYPTYLSANILCGEARRICRSFQNGFSWQARDWQYIVILLSASPSIHTLNDS